MQNFINNNIIASIQMSDLGVVLDVLIMLVCAIAVIMVVMCFAALGVVMERKTSAFVQGRLGPNRTEIPWIGAIPFIGNFLKKNGLMQLAADGLKFLLKEDPLPAHVNKIWFILAPIITLSPVLIVGCVVPFSAYYIDDVVYPFAAANFELSLLFVLAVSSLGVYGAILAGWASNNKFAYFGGMRASAQVISYELAMWLSVLAVVVWAATKVEAPLSLFGIVMAQSDMWFIFTQPLTALIFLVALFAETNRLPFDVAESETDLVSSFFTEYGSFKFGLFFVGEYGHMVIASCLFICLFLGGSSPIPGLEWPMAWGLWSTLLGFITFLVKIFLMMFFFILIRWTLPRFRYDQVMDLGWKVLVPLGIFNLIFYIIISTFKY